ncbi:MAG: hypothetical protein FK733_15345 [Asgard group archaeon]|nr:hypothetical protein [Asgard group archaeon]
MSGKENKRKLLRGFSLALILPVIILIIGASIYNTSLVSIAISFLIIGGTISGILISLAACVLCLNTMLFRVLPDSTTPQEIDKLVIEFENRNITEEKLAEDYGILLKILEQPLENSICMISKTDLEDKGLILQCVVCENCFLPEYILDWLKANNTCPVCRSKIKEK